MSGSPNVLLRIHYYEKGSDKRDFYSSQKTNNDYLGYMDKGHRSGQYADYMDYQGNREKSSGVFDENGLMDERRKAEFRKGLQATDSSIWDVIISTEERFGKERLRSWQAAKDMLKAELPKFLKDNRMSYRNVAWCAALHENTDNRHIHLLLHEKQMEIYDPDTKRKRFHRGTLSKLSMEDFRIRIEQRLMGHEHSLHLYRDELLKREEEKLKGLDPKAVYSKDLKAMLLELYRKAPKGNYGYGSEKANEIRPLIDQITTYMLTGDDASMRLFMDLLRKLKQKDEETKAICLRGKIDPSPHLIASSFKKDLYRRCGNKILKHIRTAQSLESGYKKGDDTQKERWNEKTRRKFLFDKALRLDAEVSNERIEVFDEFQRLLRKAEHDRLVEEGVIEAR